MTSPNRPRPIPVHVIIELVGGEHDGARLRLVVPLPQYVFTHGSPPDTMLYTVLAEVMADHPRAFAVYRREAYTDYLNDVTRYVLEREAP